MKFRIEPPFLLAFRVAFCQSYPLQANRGHMALTELEVRSAKARAKDYKLSDAFGLYLLVRTNGSKAWNLAYRFSGKQKKLTLGAYPLVGLGAARAARETARKTLAGGQDPSVVKRLAKITAAVSSANTFKVVAEEWLLRRTADGATPGTIKKHTWLLSLAYPMLGNRPVADIMPPEVLEILARVEKTGRLESAVRLRSTCSAVFRFAIRTARAIHDPTVPLRGATLAPKVTHHAAILDPKRIGPLVRSLRGYDGNFATRSALQLVALTFVRSKELRFAAKSEFDLDAGIWTLSAERMKMTLPHFVPLSRQAVAVVREAMGMTPGELLFPAVRSITRPISENTINAALRRMGYGTTDMTGHGFRRMASTVLNEHGFHRDWIERQLAHKDKNQVREAYNAAEYLPGRKIMMQWWADFLDRLAEDDEDLIG
jgi:integrase